MNKVFFCFRPGKHRNKIIKNTGIRMIETGKTFTMSEHIVELMAKRVGIELSNKTKEKEVLSLSIAFPVNVYKAMRKLAADRGISINQLILKTEDEYRSSI